MATELESPRRIVQSWRTRDFADADVDSRIEVTFRPEGENSRVAIGHSGVPDGQLGYENGGWATSYFALSKKYFSQR